MKSEGVRRKTRRKFSKAVREKNKVTNLLKTFSISDSVVVRIDSSVQDGMPDPKFHGRVGRVVGIAGKCYKIELKDFGKRKTLVVNPAHLKVAR